MKKRSGAYAAAAIVSLITLAVYLRSLRNGFVEWDDKLYVLENIRIRALDVSLFKWAFSDFYAANWHPLTWLSHAVDYALWGLHPAGHHLTNIILHTANTFLVVILAVRLLEIRREAAAAAGSPASFDNQGAVIAGAVTGLLFGIHPIHAESVAWIAERKDLLCALFFLLSIGAYIGSVRKTTFPGQGSPALRFLRKSFVACPLLFALALLSKPMAVTLPFVLLILDWFPLGRIRSRETLRDAVIEKAPFVALSIGSSAVTIMAQQAGGAIVPFGYYPLATRVLVALQSFTAYLGNMAAPTDLSPYYAYPRAVSLLSLEYLVPVALIATIASGCILSAKKQPVWTACTVYYAVTLLPVLGIIQVGGQSMADRYTYLPSLGPFLLAGGAAARAWAWASAAAGAKGKVRRGLIAVSLVFAMAGLAYLTLQQIDLWHDGISLWNAVISKKPGASAIPYNNRGELFYQMGKFDQALADLDQAVAVDPTDPISHNNRGLALEKAGRFDEAADDYTRAISLFPSYAAAYYNRGILNFRRGRSDESLADFTSAISLDSHNATYYNNRGIVFADRGRYDRALTDFNTALEVDPGHITSYLNRGAVYRKLGNRERAVADFRAACLAGSRDGCDEMRSFR